MRAGQKIMVDAKLLTDILILCADLHKYDLDADTIACRDTLMQAVSDKIDADRRRRNYSAELSLRRQS